MTHRFIQKHHVTHDSSVQLKMRVKVWVSVAVFPHEALRRTKIQMQLNPWSWSKLPVGDCARTTNALIIKLHTEPAGKACWGLSEELSWLSCTLPGHVEPEGPVWCWFHFSRLKHEAVWGGLYQLLSSSFLSVSCQWCCVRFEPQEVHFID